MLIGLITKNGILIVEFANQLRSRGLDPMALDPFVILLTVPLAVTGALAALKLSGGTLNIRRCRRPRPCA